MTPTIEDTQNEDATVTESPIVERERSHLNEREQQMLKELLRPGAVIEAVIPLDASAEQLWHTLDACVRGMGMLEARICRLKPVIGVILVRFESKPSLYMSLGYDTFSVFMTKGVYGILGLHRTCAYEAKYVAKEWPQLSPDRYAKIGTKRMNVLHKFTDGRNSNAEGFLQIAETMTTAALQNYVESRGFLSPGEGRGATITIHTNQNIYAHWKDFCADGRIQSVVGSKDPDNILEALLQECSEEWLDRHERERLAKQTKIPASGIIGAES